MTTEVVNFERCCDWCSAGYPEHPADPKVRERGMYQKAGNGLRSVPGEVQVPAGATLRVGSHGVSVETEPRSILQEAIEVTGSHRPAEYGHPLDHFAKTIGSINQMFTETVKARLAAGKPMFEPEDWPKFLIIDKVSRSIEAYKRDNMVDVAGYAQTHEWVIEERARRDQQKREGK